MKQASQFGGVMCRLLIRWVELAECSDPLGDRVGTKRNLKQMGSKWARVPSESLDQPGNQIQDCSQT